MSWHKLKFSNPFFKLRILLHQINKILKIQWFHYQVAKMWWIENLSLWLRFKIVHRPWYFIIFTWTKLTWVMCREIVYLPRFMRNQISWYWTMWKCKNVNIFVEKCVPKEKPAWHSEMGIFYSNTKMPTVRDLSLTFHCTTTCCNKFTGWWHSTAQRYAATSLQVGDIPPDNNMLEQVYRLVKFHLTTSCCNKFTGWWHSTWQLHAATSLQVG